MKIPFPCYHSVYKNLWERKLHKIPTLVSIKAEREWQRDATRDKWCKMRGSFSLPCPSSSKWLPRRLYELISKIGQILVWWSISLSLCLTTAGIHSLTWRWSLVITKDVEEILPRHFLKRAFTRVHTPLPDKQTRKHTYTNVPTVCLKVMMIY